MIAEREARPIRLTASGEAIGRDTRLAGFSIQPSSTDLIVNFQNNKTRVTFWTAEADAGSGSHAEKFDPPLRCRDGIYVEFSQEVANQSVSLSVIEPVPTP